MSKKIIISIIIVIAVVAAIIFFGQPGAPGSSPLGTKNTTTSLPVDLSPVVVSTSTVPENPVVTVLYTDQGFSPMSVTVKKGTIINFLNQSTRPFWPASNPHPAHNGYPQSGSCHGNAFDSCQTLPKGTGWTFQFNNVGSWGYHDHLSPAFGGKIIVTE